MAPAKHLLHLFQRNAVASGWSYPHLSKGGSLIRRRCNDARLSGVVFASSAASKVSSPSSSATTMTNYFDILGVEQSFLQSPSELKAKYKSLMSKFHPDRHHALASAASPSSNNNEEEVRSQMATMATDVTRAYSVLEDPLSRSLHLLELGGEAISESDRSIVNNNLLMKIMMVREEVDNACKDEELRPILQSCREEQDEICEKLAVSFRKERMEDAKYLTAELQYWKRVEETIIEKMQSVD